MNLNYNKKRIRKSFEKIKNKLDIKNLLFIQIESFKNFINKNNNFYNINNVLNFFFPILNNNKTIEIKYINYKLNNSLFNTKECKTKELTYSFSLKLDLLLIQRDLFNNIINEILYNDIYICEIPNMTNNGTFIINGTERVIVPQLSRSPGVYFSYLKDKIYNKKKIYNAKIIPYRGSWLNIEFDNKNILFIKIDKKKKILLTTFLHALNLNNDYIIDFFFKKINVFFLNNNDIILEFDFNIFNIEEIEYEIEKIKSSFILIQDDYIDNNIRKIKINNKYLINKILYNYYNNSLNIYNIYIKNGLINNCVLDSILKNNIKNINVLFINKINYLPIYNTLCLDNTNTEEESLIEIYKYLKNGDIPDFKIIKNILNNLFFNSNKYDLTYIGRMKINYSLSYEKDYKKHNNNFLNKYDILFIVKKLIDINNKKCNIDNLDNLSNRRVKLVGEMIENQFRIGISRLEKSIKEKITYIYDINNINKNDLINSKLISSIIKEFFTSSPLSQFMDQNNPLSELTHKRRISSLGPGGLMRDRAGFDIRDIHNSHYGRLCPIETPEGPNIGLINSLSIYSRINQYGFIETPYKEVINRKITNKIVYLSSLEDFDKIITQSDINISDNFIVDNYVMCRFKGEFLYIESNKINYIDSSPQQIISIGVSLIPFLEHNDANRSLMGANMQRQAVPIIGNEYPLIGTGFEKLVASNSSNIIYCKRSGKVIYVDSKFIVIKSDINKILDIDDNDDIGIDIYELNKFDRSNQNTIINNKVCVKLFDYIEKNEIIADNQSTDIGELSLGKNVRTAFMSWYGYNYEDSIIISENLVKNDSFSSIHIQEFSCIQRETKLGAEKITYSVPNINPSSLLMLDKSGIVSIGSYVSEGDILVGKITPKNEIQLTPEEKLLKAIFGDKTTNIEDTSLKVPNGIKGTVIDIQIFHSNKFKNKDFNDNSNIFIKYNVIKKSILMIINELYLFNINKKLISDFIKYNDINLYNDLTKTLEKNIKDNKLFLFYKKLLYKYININNFLNKDVEFENFKNSNISELSPGIIKIIKIYIATKKKIKEGDKISGRYGNKGVISKICPIEDMPFDKDGNIIDMILNPLGVPSRMNIGQIMEVHLGMAAKEIGNNIKKIINKDNKKELREYITKIYKLGIKNCENININDLSENDLLTLSNNLIKGLPISSPPFDGINEKEIKEIFEFVNLSKSGKIKLYDGITGIEFDREVTVGYMYIMKLNHLVDDKIHARSTGSYSLITQQPLGGKSQFGGQRFGEMEVWALEAYGASYTLQEMLTIKSDDIYGRIKMYKSIIKNKLIMEPSIPESFNVLLKEMKSLCLNIDLKKK